MNKHSQFIRITVIGGILAAGAVQSNAQEAPSLDALNQKVSILERKLELADEAKAADAAKVGVVAAGKDGFSLTSADKAFQLKIRGYIQSDARFYTDDVQDKQVDSFLVRRARPILEGKAYESFDFRLMPDFGSGATVLQDAYVGYTASHEFKIRTGKFKAPFGLERLQSGTDLSFVERAHPTSLAPNRDIGAQIHGDVLAETLNYAVGAFNGVVDGGSADADTNDGKDFIGRLFLTPFKHANAAALSGLSFGVAGSAGDQEGTPSAPGLPSFKSIGQQTIFSYKSSTNAADGVVAAGERTRFSPQALYYYKGLGLVFEYVESDQEVAKGSSSDSLKHTAYQVAGSYVLTGEDASYKGVNPRRPFAPEKGDWGAVELVARATSLDLDDASFGTYADAKKSVTKTDTVGVGVNWYLSKNLKVSTDYDVSTFEGGDSAGDRPDEEVLFTRVQVAF